MPKIGTKAETIVTRPQRAAFGTPKMVKPMPAKMPWMVAIMRYPRMTEFTASLILVKIVSL